jgi:adenosylcobinamide kinase / adenosylcobinamide-phosphate guanylyltransferase
MYMQECRTKSVTLVLGGVRSGKSRYAQRLAERAQRVTFIATAEAREDAEMQSKIARHRADRPQHWLTIEEPIRLANAIHTALPASDAVLIDCLTIFAANLLETYGDNEAERDSEIDKLCAALNAHTDAQTQSIILVSNEVGSGVVPAYPVGRQFRDLVGEINQRVAAVADTVLLMVAGLPLPLKGSVPSEVAQ